MKFWRELTNQGIKEKLNYNFYNFSVILTVLKKTERAIYFLGGRELEPLPLEGMDALLGFLEAQSVSVPSSLTKHSIVFHIEISENHFWSW